VCVYVCGLLLVVSVSVCLSVCVVLA